MERLYKTYKDDAEFLLVYIREAHPDSVLIVEKDGQEELLKVTQTETLQSRIETAQTCLASLHLSIPTLVDKPDNAVNAAYSGWPDRLVVVGLDGNIVYYWEQRPRRLQAARSRKVAAGVPRRPAPGMTLPLAMA